MWFAVYWFSKRGIWLLQKVYQNWQEAEEAREALITKFEEKFQSDCTSLVKIKVLTTQYPNAMLLELD